MVIGLIPDLGDVLDRDSTRNLIRNLIPALIDRGLGVTAARNDFRAAGFRFGNTWFSDTFREVSGIETSLRYPGTLRRQDTPRADLLFRSSDPTPRAFKFITEITVLDPSTNRPDVIPIGVDFDIIPTRGEIEQQTEDFVRAKYPILADRILGSRLIKGFKS